MCCRDVTIAYNGFILSALATKGGQGRKSTWLTASAKSCSSAAAS